MRGRTALRWLQRVLPLVVVGLLGMLAMLHFMHFNMQSLRRSVEGNWAQQQHQRAVNVRGVAQPDATLGPTPPRLEIILFAYNRPASFERLWSSLEAAEESDPSQLQTELVVHMDYDPSHSPAWQKQKAMLEQLQQRRHKHGPLKIVFSTTHKSLRGALSEGWAPAHNSFAMFLEDDVRVAPLVLRYAQRVISAYSNQAADQTGLLGFQLYNQQFDETNQQPLPPPSNGHAPFRTMEPCFWATIFRPQPFADFLSWFSTHSHIDPLVPHSWTNVWHPENSIKKFLHRFMWERGLTLLSINFPDRLSLATNDVAPGVNVAASAPWLDTLRKRVAVPLLTRDAMEQVEAKYQVKLLENFPPLDTLLAFDVAHRPVDQIRPASPQELADFDINKVPRAELLAPLAGAHTNVRDVLLDRSMRTLRKRLGDPGQLQPAHNDLTAVEEEALRMLLQKDGVPPEVHRTIKDRGTLFAVARLLIGREMNKGILLEAEYGLTNRLRALASAMNIASESHRFLLVVWPLDVHMGVPYHELFSPPADGAVYFVSNLDCNSLIGHESVKSRFSTVDLLAATKHDGVTIDSHQKKHLYIKSAFRFTSKNAFWFSEILYLRDILARPSAAVQAVLDEYYNSLPKNGALSGEDVHREMTGVHVRMETNVQKDTPGVEGLEALRMQLATVYRLSCHHHFFAEKMAAAPSTTQFFLSADDPSAYAALQERFPHRIHFINRQQCTDRSPKCMLFATADLILLSRSKELITSKWSAFSETALRAGRQHSQDGCSAPPEGWIKVTDADSARALEKQVREYLDLHGLSDSEALGPIILAIRKFLVQ